MTFLGTVFVKSGVVVSDGFCDNVTVWFDFVVVVFVGDVVIVVVVVAVVVFVGNVVVAVVVFVGNVVVAVVVFVGNDVVVVVVCGSCILCIEIVVSLKGNIVCIFVDVALVNCGDVLVVVD